MNRPRRDAQAGLTLVEVLVALALFSMIALAGFTVLDNILRVRAGTEDRLERLARIDQALVLFSRDLQQSEPEFLIQNGQRISVTRTGIGILSYSVREGAFVRSLPRAKLDQRLVEDVSGIRLRGYDTIGRWHDVWPVDDASVLGLKPYLRAVELQLELPQGGVSRLVEVQAGEKR